MKKLFHSKAFYITLLVIFSFVLAADVGIALLLPDTTMPSGNFTPPSGSFEMPSGDFTPPSGDFEMPSGDFTPPSGDFERPSMSDGDSASTESSGFPGGSFPASGSFPTTKRGFFGSVKQYWIAIAAVCVVVIAFSGFMLRRIRGSEAPEAPEEETEEEEALPPKKKRVWPWLAGMVAVIAALLILLPTLTGSKSASSVEAEKELLTAEAETGSLSEALINGGSLTETGEETIALAGRVRLTGWCVEDGEYVTKGTLLANVDKNSILAAISDVTEMMAELDADLVESGGDTVATYITAPADGRVAAIYAASGEQVIDVMYEHNALILLSLDGRFAVDIPAGELGIGDIVSVTLSNGTVLSGTVSSVGDGTAVVTVSDSASTLGDAVQVHSADGAELGSDELYIHSELKITGFSGRVSSLYTSVGYAVTAGQNLLSLTETEYSGRYNTLLQQRADLEEQLTELFEVLEAGGLYAASDGSVSELNEDIVDESAATAQPTVLTYSAEVPATRSSGIASALRFLFGTTSRNGGTATLLGTAVTLGGEGPGGEGSGGEQHQNLTQVYAQITAVDTDAQTVSMSLLSDQSTMAVSFAELTALQISPDSLQVGSILCLKYTEEGKLVSVTVYSAGSGSIPGGKTGGFSVGSATTEDDEEDEPDYIMEETELYTHTAYDTVEIEMTVDELDIMRLSRGQTVAVFLDALPGQSFEGTISDIDPEGSNDGGNSKFTVTVSMERSEKMLAGMNADIRIELAKRENLLLIPAAAICEDESGVYVYTSYDEKEELLGGQVYVTTGFSDGESVEITSGLAEGDTVYYLYADTLVYTFTKR